jgi:Uncharacterized conserved protein
MSERVFATEIVGLEVRTDDGRTVGTLDDVVVDLSSGEMIYLLIKDPTDVCKQCKTDPDGRKMLEFVNIDVDGSRVIVSL